LAGLFNFFEEVSEFNIGITKRALERLTVNFVMERENNHSFIFMLHLDVAAFPVNLDKAQARQCC